MQEYGAIALCNAEARFDNDKHTEPYVSAILPLNMYTFQVAKFEHARLNEWNCRAVGPKGGTIF